MQSPAKVIAAFIGVFVAGAIFGSFLSIGIGARWVASQPPPAAPVVSAAASATPPAAPAAVAQGVANPGTTAAANAAQRPTLLQVPFSWQAPQLMRRYADRLDLTAEQKERITPLIHRAIDDYRRVQQTTFRETGIILQRLQQDIAKELTPEQQQKLHEMEERQREMLQRLEQRQREQRKGATPPRNKARAEKPAAGSEPASSGALAEPEPGAANPTTGSPAH